jgi:hypothetical protein
MRRDGCRNCDCCPLLLVPSAALFRRFLSAGEGEFAVLKAAALEEQKKARGSLLQWVSSKTSGVMSG